jgi:hypothetical protein
MEDLKRAIKDQFGCSKSLLKMHDFRFITTDHYKVEERCVKCLSQRA